MLFGTDSKCIKNTLYEVINRTTGKEKSVSESASHHKSENQYKYYLNERDG